MILRMNFKNIYLEHGNKFNIALSALLVIIIFLISFLQLTPINSSNGKENNKQEVAGISTSPTPSVLVNEVNEKFTNPLTGKELSEQEYKFVKDRNVYAVVINNEINSRPQSGINEADIVYEFPVEGGITRFLGIYWSETPNKIMSLRSARKYFIDVLGDYKTPVFMHIGAAEGGVATNAITAMNANKILSVANDGNTYKRDINCEKEKSTEHCAYTEMSMLDAVAQRNNYQTSINQISLFKYLTEEDKTLTQEKDIPIKLEVETTVNSTQEDYKVLWKYNEQNKKYTRYYFNDLENPAKDSFGTEIQTDVLIVQKAEIYDSGDDKNRLIIDMIGSGKGKVFQNGKEYEITWEKQTFSSPTQFIDEDGNPFKFAAGKKWITVE